MKTRTMTEWETGICQVKSGTEEDIEVRGHSLDDLVGKVSFAAMMCLMLRGQLPTAPEERVLDALLVASMEHGIAPPSMVARCFASYGTSIQAAVSAGVSAFGDRMGGLGEEFAHLMADWYPDRREDVSADALASAATEVVRQHREKGTRVPGFGIPLHGADPRAPAVLKVAYQQGVAGLYCRFASAIEGALAEQRGGRPVPMNLDGVSAAVILDLGFTWQSARLFLLTPRTVSMGAHYLEEQQQDTVWRHIPANQIHYQQK